MRTEVSLFLIKVVRAVLKVAVHGNLKKRRIGLPEVLCFLGGLQHSILGGVCVCVRRARAREGYH